MKKSIALICLAVLLLLAGCSGNGKQSVGQTGDQGKDADQQKLTIWAYYDVTKQYYEQVAEQFKKTHPNVKIDIQLLEIQALMDKYTIITKSGGDGSPDLVDIEQGAFPTFIHKEIAFEPLDDYLQRDKLTDALSPGPKNLFAAGGKLYAIVNSSQPVALYYRKDVFDKAGIDASSLKTWDQFTEQAKKLINKDTYIFPPGQPWNSITGMLELFQVLLKQAGSDIVTADGKVGIDTPQGQEAIARLDGWLHSGIMSKTSPEGPAFWKAYNDGHYLASFGPDWWANQIADNASPDLSGKWAAIPLPLGGEGSVPTSVWGGSGLAISKFSKQKELAWEFIKLAFLDKEMVLKRYEITNQYPALIPALSDPRLTDAKTKYTEYFSAGEPLGKLYAGLIPQAPKQNQAWWRRLIGEAWEKYQFDYFADKISAKQFLSNVQAELEKLIKDEEAKQ